VHVDGRTRSACDAVSALAAHYAGVCAVEMANFADGIGGMNAAARAYAVYSVKPPRRSGIAGLAS
jgi:hypothetical protein